MPYPRELNLDEDTEERLRSYIDQELRLHYHERSENMDELHKWQRDYWAKPRAERATFPFTGAATLVIPLTAIAVEAFHARVMTTMFTLDQFVVTKPVSDDWEDAAHPVERFMTDELITRMKFRDTADSMLLEAEKFGNCIGKVGYVRDIRKAIREGPNGEDEEYIITLRQGAVIDQVSIGRFLMPYYSQDPQTSPWVGEEHSETPFWILNAEQSGLFREGTYENLKRWVSLSQTGSTGQERKFEFHQAQLEEKQPFWPQRIDWQEVWMGFDVDGDGREEEIVIHFHQQSRSFMSIRYNYNADLRRPYRIGKFFPIENRWTAIGISKQNEQFQREVTTQHRQRIDNATLANMRMFKIHKVSGYGPREPIFPGKMWFVDDMTHIDTMQLGEIYPSAYNDEQATLTYSQQRTGINEMTLGMPQVGTPGTATSDLAKIQEGNKKFDYIYDNLSGFVDQLIIDTAVTIQQYGPRNISYYDLADGGDLVKKFFEMPAGLIKDGLLIKINRANQTKNEILDRQNWMQIAQVLQQYYTGLMQLAGATQNQQLMEQISIMAMRASTEAAQQILQSFDIRNIDRIIMKDLLKAIPPSILNGVPNPNGQGNPQIGPGGNPGTPGTQATPPVGNFNAIAQTLASAGASSNGKLLNAGAGA